MERDFLGLSSKEQPVAVVKEEISTEGYKEIGFAKGSGVQWPFSNKVTAVPHFMTFKAAQEDKTRKIVCEPLVSSGFMPTIPTVDAYDPSKDRSTAEVQKSFNHDRQGGTHISLTAYSVQHDSHPSHPLHHPHDVKTFPVNQAISVSVNNPFFKNHFATVGQNLGGANMKQQLLGGIPVATPHSSLPTFGSVAGITEQGNAVKTHAPPAQLTIFYAGSVSVYEDISPEKAQAIMFLAGNGSSIAPKAAQPNVQFQELAAAVSNVTLNQSISAPPSTGLSSPISVSSQTGAHSGSGSTCTEDMMVVKTTGVPSTPVCTLENPKPVNAGPVATTSTVTAGPAKFYAAFPQARKASLASFLEKRKQRAMNAAPYFVGKKSTECFAPERNDMNISASKAG